MLQLEIHIFYSLLNTLFYYVYQQAVEFFEYKNIFNQIIVAHVSDQSKTYLPFEFQSTTIYEDYKVELLSRYSYFGKMLNFLIFLLYPEANYNQFLIIEKTQGQENVRNQILNIAGDLNVSYLIVGFNGRKGVKQDVTILGQTVRNSVYTSKVPLIAVKKLYTRDETNGFKFVVCIDGSKKSYKSLESAIALSFDERDSLLICFAPTPDREAFGTTIKSKVEEFMAKYQRKWQYKQLDASYRAIENVIEMINNSDDLDFVVFGSNGYRAQLESKTFFGSTADELLKKAKANIIMVQNQKYNFDYQKQKQFIQFHQVQIYIYIIKQLLMKETTQLKPVTQKKNKSNFLLEMNEKDKEINNQIIKNMNKRVNYLKNPRFKINKAPVLFSYINTKQDIVVEKDQITSFRVFPKQLIFREYMLNGMYEIDLYVTNATGTLQRIKVLPPEKKEFQIASIKYPTKEDGFIAPGMSAVLKVRFNPSSLAEFDDTIAVITEDHILKVPLLARKEPPQLDLPSQLDCQSCWIGDQVETRFVVKNTGGEAGYRFFINNQQDQQEEENYIQIGNFYLTPAEFFLHKGETQIIQAIFKPDAEGEAIENIILGCDNLTQATLKMIGRGNMVELGILGIDNINLENQDQLQKIFFNDPIPKVETSRQLKIRNKTSVKVQYHWYLQNDDKELKLEDEQNCYSIQPQEGFFQPNEVIDFKIFLKSEEYYPLFQTAYLIIDDIPFESIRNPPSNLRQQFENNSQSVAIGSNSIKPSITYFEFELISKSALGEVSVTPQFYKFPVPICVNTLASYKFKLLTTSKTQMKYQINPLQLDYFYIQDKQGILNNEAEIVLGVQSSEVGNMKLEYRIDFDYANSILITVFADIIAPFISLKQSWLNYGLIQTYSLESQELTINNLSPVPALIKAQSGSDQRLLFNKDQFEIKPNSSIQFKVEFQSREAETYNDFLYFQVENGDCAVLDVLCIQLFYQILFRS